MVRHMDAMALSGLALDWLSMWNSAQDLHWHDQDHVILFFVTEARINVGHP